MPATPPPSPWDDRFAGPGYLYGTEPNAFLVQQRHRLDRGMSVLAVADGEGRNGVWLAEQGMKVTSVDGSAVGLQKALTLALRRQVILRTICADLTDWPWPDGTFDAVAAIFIHFPSAVRAAMHAGMIRALKPGGLLLMEAFHKDQLGRTSGGPPVADMLYDTETLRADMTAAGAEIVLLEQVEQELDEGRLHKGAAATIQMVARRL